MSEDDDGLSRRQRMRLEQRAVGEKWPSGQLLRTEIMWKMGRIAIGNLDPTDDRIKAARTVMAGEKLNMDERRLQILEGVTKGLDLAQIAREMMEPEPEVPNADDQADPEHAP